MPGDATATHPSGKVITFLEEPHTYTDSDGMSYTSATTLVEMSVPEFDPDGEILKRCAARDGITPEQLKAQWEREGEIAGVYGTKCHENAEFQFTKQFKKTHNPCCPKEEIAFRVIWDKVAELQETLTFLSCEQIVFSPKYAISGSIDLLMVDHVNRVLWILDWKTNKLKKMVWENKYGGRMLGHLSHLHDASLVHYALQLGIYERIIRDDGYLEANGMAGYDIRRKLLYIPPMQEQIIEIELPDASLEVAEMLIAKAYNLPF